MFVRRGLALTVVPVVLVAATGCGSNGTTPATTPAKRGTVGVTATQNKAALAKAVAIKVRFAKAGYSTAPVNWPPGAKPFPGQRFNILVDFATPHSFEFNVLIFRTSDDASTVARQERLENRASQQQTREKVVGTIVFAASTDSSASLPVYDFNKTVELAEGLAVK